MIYFPETIIQWAQCYWGYLHTIFLLAMHVNTHSVHNRILKPWRGRLLCVFSSRHVFSPPLSRLNWHSLTPTGGPGPSTPKMASLPTGSSHTPFLGSRTEIALLIAEMAIFTADMPIFITDMAMFIVNRAMFIAAMAMFTADMAMFTATCQCLQMTQ